MDLQSLGQAAFGNPTFLTVSGTVTAALISGFWVWRTGRPSAQAAMQGKLFEGFQMNLKTMQDMQAQWQVERKELLEEVTKLRRDVVALTRHIGLLERTMAAKGIDAPERPEAMG